MIAIENKAKVIKQLKRHLYHGDYTIIAEKVGCHRTHVQKIFEGNRSVYSNRPPNGLFLRIVEAAYDVVQSHRPVVKGQIERFREVLVANLNGEMSLEDTCSVFNIGNESGKYVLL